MARFLVTAATADTDFEEYGSRRAMAMANDKALIFFEFYRNMKGKRHFFFGYL